MEGEIGRFRRRHLTPVPAVASLAALNEALAAADARDDARRIGARAETVGVAAARELGLLNPLPFEAFDVSASLWCRVDAKARVCVRQSYYSVPARFAGRRLEVRLGASGIRVLEAGQVVAEHPRSLHKGSEDLLLDHYLEVLGRKPGALAGSTALVAARASGAFTVLHQRYWNAARIQHGDGPGTRALVGVLLLHRTLPAGAVAAGMAEALALGNFDADLVALAARSFMFATPATGLPVPVPVRVSASPTARTPRPTPSLSQYDQLLKEVSA